MWFTKKNIEWKKKFFSDLYKDTSMNPQHNILISPDKNVKEDLNILNLTSKKKSDYIFRTNFQRSD